MRDVAGGVDTDRASAGRAAQVFIAGFLDALLAHAVGLVIGKPLKFILIVIRSRFTDIADQMGGERTERILADGHDDQVRAVEIAGALGKSGDLLGGEIAPYGKGQGTALLIVNLDIAVREFVLKSQFGAEHSEVRLGNSDDVAFLGYAQLVEINRDVIAGTIVCKDDTIAIDDFSTGRGNADAAERLRILLVVIMLATHDLYTP